MIDTKVVYDNKIDREVFFAISINLQHWLKVYIEPELDKPETFEDDNRTYLWTYEELQELVDTALHKCEQLLKDVFVCMGHEAAHLSYKEVSLLNRPEDLDFEIISDSRYTAEEDLTFLHTSIGILYDFIFEARCILL
jgi:hypothetical protein